MLVDRRYHNTQEGLGFLFPAEMTGQKQGYNSNGNHGCVYNEVVAVGFYNNKKDLKLTAKDEEEIKLQQSNVDLQGLVTVSPHRHMYCKPDM